LVIVRFTNLDFDKGLFLKKSADRILVEVKGHAGFYNSGVDLACAGISAVSQTLLVSIDRLTEAKANITAESGNLVCEIYINGLSELELSKVLLLLESLIIGLVEIAKEYPDSVKIEFVS
jgi:hypothetical protein